MKFDCIIMNPPYQRNLHLKILAESITHLKDEKSTCVNLSPVRWLQDPLAKYKKNNDYHRFENSISKFCNKIELIKTEDARRLFNVELLQPLAIYKCDKKSTYSYYNKYFKNAVFIDKVFKKILSENNFEKHKCVKLSNSAKCALLTVFEALLAAALLVPAAAAAGRLGSAFFPANTRVSAWSAVLTVIFGLMPALSAAFAIEARLMPVFKKPRPLPRLSLRGGIGEENRTLVAVPVLITSEKSVRQAAETLEAHYLAAQSLQYLRIFPIPPRKQSGEKRN